MTAALQRLYALGRGNALKAQLVRGALGVGGLKLLSLPLTLVASVLLARGLGPESYGQYSFVMAVLSLLVLPVGPGLGQLVTREVAKFHHGEEWGLFRGLLKRAHQWVILGSILLMVIIAMLAARNASWVVNDHWTLLFLASPLLPLLGLNALRTSILRGLRKIIFAQIPELLVRPSLHLVIVSGLLLTGLLNPATALASQVVVTTLSLALGLWLFFRCRPRQIADAKPVYLNGEWGGALLPFTFLAIVSTFNAQIGILVLGWLGSDTEVGAFRVAQNGAMFVSLSLTIVNMVLGPHITRANRDKDISRLQHLSRQSARAALVAALPVAIPLIFFGEPIINLIFGEDYTDVAVWPLAILAVGQLVNVAFGSVGLFLTMTGYERDTLFGHVTALVATVLAAVTLTPPFGAVGAALAVTIGLVTWNAVLAIRFIQRMGFRPSAL